MKKVFVWTIQHTGTFFASGMLTAGTSKDRFIRGFGSLEARHAQLGHKRYTVGTPNDFADYCPTGGNGLTEEWFDQYILDLVGYDHPPAESGLGKLSLDNIDLFVAHEHHHRVGTHLLDSMLHHKPVGMYVVLPMRDPLLSLHSKRWRESEVYKSGKKSWRWRENLTRRWMQLYEDFLTIPNDHAFILPIDSVASQKEASRLKLVGDLYDFCGLDFNAKAQKATKRWKPKNSTHKLVTNKYGHSDQRWQIFKNEYAVGNLRHVRKVMDVEIDLLKQNKKLINLLKDVGYKDLLWW